MSEARKSKLLPYLRGGVPGALAALLFALGIVSILLVAAFLVASVIVFGAQNVVGGIEILALSLSYIPMIIAGFGALKLRKGNAKGASMMLSACLFRRVLLAIGMILIVLVALIGFFRVIGFSFLAALLVLLIYGLIFGILLFMLFFINRVISVLEVIEAEATVPDAPRNIRGAARSPGVMCIILMVLSAVVVTVYCFAPGFVADTIDLGFAEDYYQYYLIILFLYAAMYALAWGFFRGVWRSHRPAEQGNPPTFGPAGYIRANAWAILGAILSAYLALTELTKFINRISVFRSYGLPLRWDVNMFRYPVGFVAALILAVGLLIRHRSVLILIASLISAAFYGYLVSRALPSGSFTLGTAKYAVEALFFVLLAVAAIVCLRPDRRLPKGLRVPLIILAALYLGLFLTDAVLTLTGSRKILAEVLLALPTGLIMFFWQLDLSLAVGSHPDDQEKVELESVERLYDRALREGCQPIRLHSVKGEAVQNSLMNAEVGWECTVEREVREGKKDRWRVRHGESVLGSLKEEEYTEGQSVVLASVVMDDDGILRPSVMLL